MCERIKSYPRYGSASYFNNDDDESTVIKQPTGYEVIESLERQYADDMEVGSVLKELYEMMHGEMSEEYGEEVQQKGDNNQMKFSI